MHSTVLQGLTSRETTEYFIQFRQTLGGPFSAVSTATIATKYSFFQIFRDLQDSQNGFLEFCKFSQNFAKFSWNFLIFGDFCWNRSKSVILACNSNEIWSELREITDNSRNSMTIAEFFWKSRKNVNFFKKLAKNAWRKMKRLCRPPSSDCSQKKRSKIVLLFKHCR